MTITARIRSAWDALFAPSEPERLPDGVPALTAPTPSALTRATVDLVRNALEAHESGQFAESAQLARHLLRDPDLQAAQLQRVLALLGLPFCFEPADDSEQASALAAEATTLWPRLAPSGEVGQLLRDVTMLGFTVGVLRYRYHEDAAQVLPTLERWPAEYVYCVDGRWFAIAQEGVFRITPGDGRWVLWTPHGSQQSYDYGAVRCLSSWVLRAEHGARDAGRWSETKGQGIWLAKLPTMQAETPEGASFVRSVRNMGRAPVVPLPQGPEPSQSFGLELVESKSDGWQGFDFLLSTEGRKVRLAILGQDMTSVSGPDGGSYAQSEVGDGVRQDLQEADAEGLATVLREQLVLPWVRLRAGDTALAPHPYWNATPPEDLAETAAAQLTAAQAMEAWKAQGADVDVVAHAQRYGVPLLSDKVSPPAPTTPPRAWSSRAPRKAKRS